MMRRFVLLALILSGLIDAGPGNATPVTVVPKGATWTYLATSSDPGTSWRAPGFDDSSWPSGTALLGYGEPGIVTYVPYGPDPASKWRTTYFRIPFTVADDPAAILALTLEANFDDGFVAYLNGTEVRRASMPAGAVTYATFASSHESGVFETFDLSAFTGALQTGSNVLAVEVHQSSAGSSDLALDMTLRYSTDAATVTRGPYLQSGTPTGLVVRWRTDAPVSGVVRYGSAPGALTIEAGPGAPGTEHEIPLSGLAPGTRYWYSVGTPDGPLAGDSSFTFRTAPVPGSAGPARFWIIGDSGQGSQAARDVYAAYLGRPGADETSLWLMLGDNAYGTGTDAEYQAAVFDTYPELLRRSVLWPTRGNHDLLYAGGGNDYYDLFTLPTDGSAGGLASGSEAYYAFDYGPVHFVCLDSEGTDRSPGGAMLAWLRADLAATAQPWIVAYWHHPPYSKGSHDSDDPADSGGRMRDMRENVLPILDSTGVDLVLAGHSHSYERSFLLNGHYGTSGTLAQAMKVDDGDGRPDGDGPYAKPSATGAPFEGAVYAVAGTSAQSGGGTFDHPVMVMSTNALGSLEVDVAGLRMDVRFLDDGGAVRDSFTILKGGTVDVPVATAEPRLRLATPRPNPASDASRIEFELPSAGAVRLTVVDVNGRRISTLLRGVRPAGHHEVAWDGTGADGRRLAPGVYYAVLEAGADVRAVPIVRIE